MKMKMKNRKPKKQKSEIMQTMGKSIKRIAKILFQILLVYFWVLGSYVFVILQLNNPILQNQTLGEIQANMEKTSFLDELLLGCVIAVVIFYLGKYILTTCKTIIRKKQKEETHVI